MATESKFIKTKSNYVLKGKHQTINGGTVFERDFTTLSGYDGMSPDEEQVYGSSNFKFVVRNGLNQQKKHGNGRWVKDSEVTGSSTGIVSKDSKIILNPDYQSLTDFAYYGSAVDLIKSTVMNAILYFPAELYFTEEEVSLNGDTYYKISNDFGIDVITEDVKEGEVDNIMRYLAVSFHNYSIWNQVQAVQACTGALEIEHRNKDCNVVTDGAFIARVRLGMGGGEATIFVYKIGDEISLYHKNLGLAGFSIRPNVEIIEEYYDNLDDFSKVLLNRETKPRYTAIFNTPYETDNGYFTYRQSYTWPSAYGWNPDLNSLAYENYIGSLIRLATFHDEWDSDNIWRSMTHEAIKNLDWTFTRVQGEDVEEIETIDTSKIEPLLKLYGRAYDDLKRIIDNIGKSTNVSYDKRNNIPDYFLDDALNLAGWETRAVNPTDDNKVITPALYSGVTVGYTAVDANTEFMRRLKINSPYILSMKGTRKGIEAVLGLFGYEKEKDYNIKEYVVIAKGAPSYDTVVEHNRTKRNFMASEEDPLYGLPLRGIESIGGERYVVPWYERDRKYDGGTYFQMKGGWGKMKEKMVNLPDLIGEDAKYIHSNDSFTLYDETISDMKFVTTLDDLITLGRSIAKKGDVCYVTNISGMNDKYTNKPMEDIRVEDASHYFILVNDQFADKLGYVDIESEELTEEEKFGWISVTDSEIRQGESENALRILHLGSIIDDTTGNNPHMGHGRYDSGESYVENMIKPFGPTYNNKGFFMYDDEKIEQVMEDCSFTSDGYTEDNKKCWYFSDDAAYVESPDTNNGHLGTTEPDEYQMLWSGATKMDRPEIGIQPSSPEASGETNGEAAANSIINVKKFEINFHPAGFDDGALSQMHDFITNKVLFYLKQVIPSTALFEYTIGGNDGSVANNVG